MATATAPAVKRDVKEWMYSWEGRDRGGKLIKGDMKASGEAVVQSTLRRQGVNVLKIKRQRSGLGGKITEKDITLFTRQLATMMKSGVPLLQSFDIVGKGHSNPAVGKLLLDVKTEVETGSSLNQAFRKYPLYFDQLFCNLVAAGEAAGILDSLLDRLATYKEKILAIKSKIKSALFYPTAVIVVAFIITAVIMIFVIPAFKDLFKNFGADLPAPTLFMMAVSDFFVSYWYLIFGGIGGGIWFFLYTWKRSIKMQAFMDRMFLRAAHFRRHHPQGHDGALDPYPVHHVRRRRAAGGGARVRRWRFRQLRVRSGDEKDSSRSDHGYKLDGRHAEQRRVPEHGHPDGGDRRGVRRAGRDAVQGGRLL